MKYKLLWFLLLATSLAWGQGSTSDCKATLRLPTGNGPYQAVPSACSNTQSTTVSGTVLRINNNLGSINVSFEEKITGTPDSVSFVIAGCSTGGTCDTLDTYTTVANAIRSPAITKPYTYFTVTPTWVNGTTPTFTVNALSTLARNGTAGGGGAGTITGVTAGACLTGGGSSGSVTLSVTSSCPVAFDPSFGSKLVFSPSACETSYAATTLATGATTTDTGLSCLPANAVIDGVVYRITTTITTAANFTIGDATIAARFCAAQSTLTSGTTGICFAQADQTGTSGPRQVSAVKVRVTTNVNPGAGAIRLVVYYHTLTAPTS